MSSLAKPEKERTSKTIKQLQPHQNQQEIQSASVSDKTFRASTSTASAVAYSEAVGTSESAVLQALRPRASTILYTILNSELGYHVPSQIPSWGIVYHPMACTGIFWAKIWDRGPGFGPLLYGTVASEVFF